MARLALLLLTGCAGVQVKYPDHSEDQLVWACWHEHDSGHVSKDLTCLEISRFLRILKNEEAVPEIP